MRRDRPRARWWRGHNLWRKPESALRDSRRQHAAGRTHISPIAAQFHRPRPAHRRAAGTEDHRVPGCRYWHCRLSHARMRGYHAARSPKHLEGPTSLQKIYFVLFDQEALTAFTSVRSELESKV